MAALKKGKVATGGNTHPDQAWIEIVLEDGELHEPDQSQRPPDFIYDVQYQWAADADELNTDFFMSFKRPGTRQCNGTAYVRDSSGMYIVDRHWVKLRRPCLANPMKGAVVCQAHGGLVPVVKAAAQRALDNASEIVALRLIGLTGTKDEVNALIEHKTRLAAANSVLDRVGIKGGMDVEVKLPGYKNVLAKLFTEDQDADEEETG